jgi:hypothetical protein
MYYGTWAVSVTSSIRMGEGVAELLMSYPV